MAVDFLVFSLRRAASTGKQGQNFEAEVVVEPLARRPQRAPSQCLAQRAPRHVYTCAQAASVLYYNPANDKLGWSRCGWLNTMVLASFWETQHPRDPLSHKLRLG